MLEDVYGNVSITMLTCYYLYPQQKENKNIQTWRQTDSSSFVILVDDRQGYRLTDTR